MAYLGKSPSQGVRNRYYFTASGGETSISGALTGGTLTFTDGNYVDVNLNGVTLVAGTDYNTSTANTIAGLSALTASDVVEIVVYDVFSVFSGNVNSDFSVGGNLSVTGTTAFTGATTITGLTTTGDINFGDNDKAIFGAGSDLQIYHSGSHSYIQDVGQGNLTITAANFYLNNGADTENMISAVNDGAVSIAYNGATKLATTATGVSVTGQIDVNSAARIDSSGIVKAANGTAAAPTHAFLNDPDNGMFRPTTNTVGFSTAGTERMRLTSAGSLGLGVTAPDGKLNVVSTAHNNGSIFDSTGTTQLWLRDTDATSNQRNWGFQVSGGDLNIVRANDDRASGFVTPVYIQQAPANSLVINSSGNVGIGVVPDAWSGTGEAIQLGGAGHLATANQYAYIGSNYYYNGGWKYTTSSTAAQYRQDSGTHQWLTAASGSADAAITWSEAMRLDASGNLLIGKTSADGGVAAGHDIRATGLSYQTVDGGSVTVLNRLTSDGDIALFRKDGTTVGIIGNVGTYLTIGSDDTGLAFAQNTNSIIPHNTSTNAYRDNAIDLGYSSVRFKHGYFANTVYTASVAGITDNDTYINFANNNIMQFITGGSEKARFASDGNLYIAKTSDTATGVGLTLGGGGFIRAVRNEICGVFNRQGSDGTLLSFMRSNSGVGAISVTTSGTTYTTTSDIRLKQDIEPLQATDKLMQMNPVSYAWKADPDGPRSMGFIAQEMQEVMPEAVSTGEDDDAMMSMDYGRITPILVSALQDAHRKIEQLESRLAALET